MAAARRSRRPRPIPRALVLVMLVAGSACSSTDSRTTATSCRDISATEVSLLLHQRVTQHPRPGEPGECNFVSNNGTFVTIDTSSSPTAVANEKRFWTRHGRVSGSVVGATDGTATLWVPYPSDAGGGGRLSAIRSGTALSVTVTAGASDPQLVAEQTLAVLFSGTR